MAAQTRADLRQWAKTNAADGPQGRPLPVTGSWNIGRFWNTPWKRGEDAPEPQAWDPGHLCDLIERGRHVLPTFFDPMFVQSPPKSSGGVADDWNSEALQYCAKHGLPIAFRDWNLAGKVGQYEKSLERDFSLEETVFFVRNGEKTGRVSPFGPIARYRAFGRWWLSNPVMRRIQQIYPDPPRVVMLDNNEGRILGWHSLDLLDKNADRFVEKYGKNATRREKALAVRRAWQKRFRAIFEGARQAASTEGWSKNLIFTGYNNFGWAVRDLGRGTDYPQGGNRDVWFDPGKGVLEWRHYDGGMPEYYDNDWQPRKTDFGPWSVQSEAMNLAAWQSRVFERDPDYYFASIGWEGGNPSQMKGPHRNFGSKTGQYVLGGHGAAAQRWDFARYEGMLQFGLWTMRPRSFREFRGGATRNAYTQKTWNRYMQIVDRVWARDDLQRFWRHGDLVANPTEGHFLGNLGHLPGWLREMERWYLLTCEANPPRHEWAELGSDYAPTNDSLRVLAMALVLGEAPEREWLIYAHAPLGGVADTAVELPGYGTVNLPTVSRSGSFYIVHEANETVTQARCGGPPEIEVTTEASFVERGEQIDVRARVTVPPEGDFDDFEWSFSGAATRTTDCPGDKTVTFEQSGHEPIRVTGRHDGGQVVGETTVFVGEKPAQEVVYDLPLSVASVYEGPWRAVGKKWPGRLETYRLLPNPGAGPRGVVHGGRFVEDEEQGRVLELSTGPDGLWLARNELTSRHPRGHVSKTIALRFKAPDVNARQVLYEEGNKNNGFHIYLENGELHAACYASARDWGGLENGPGNGHWLRTSVTPGEWHRVVVVLDSATTEVRKGKLSLYLDGKRCAHGPGVRVPDHHLGPKIGWARADRGFFEKRFDFVGRMADFRLVNAARPPK